MSFAQFLKSTARFNSLTDSQGDEIYNRLMSHIRGFALKPQSFQIEDLKVSLAVTGLNPRFWQIDRLEDELSSWRPTILVTLPDEAYPALRFKFRSTIDSERAYASLTAALESSVILSMGDLYRTIQDVTTYPDGATRILSRDPVGLTRADLEAMNRAANEVLAHPRFKRLSMLDHIAALIPSLDGNCVDGSERSFSLMRRALRQVRKGRASQALQNALESFSGQRFESWIDAVSSMVGVQA
jgi:hypothetical protein